MRVTQMYTNYGQSELTKTKRSEYEYEAERQRLAASVSKSPRQSLLRLAICKLGVLLVKLGTWMKQVERLKQSPAPITGKL